MNFRRGMRREELEINFIPLIDLLLVILIFLLVTTTYNRFNELQVNLPSASGDQATRRPEEIVVAVSPEGQYTIDDVAVAGHDPASLSADLTRIARGRTEPTLIINADAAASHQSVVQILEAARMAGLGRVAFATSAGPAGP